MLGQHRSTQRKPPRGRDDEERLTADIIALARQYGRYGYRKVAALLRDAGWLINAKRVERIGGVKGSKFLAEGRATDGRQARQHAQGTTTRSAPRREAAGANVTTAPAKRRAGREAKSTT